MRLFVAIPLPTETMLELAAAVQRIRKRPDAEKLRWSPRESWHVTLQFLGKAGADECACLVGQLRGLPVAAVRIVPERMGTFARVGILYAGVKATSELLDLEKNVTSATAPCGFAREDRPYRPHITLARRRGRGWQGGVTSVAEEAHQLTPFSGFTAREFALYESFPGSAARYEIRERFPLDL